MALMINHNIAAIDAQRNLALTTRAMSGLMEKLSSGFRINRASDDPAGLVISEQFRAQIAGMKRAISNSEGSIAMIQTAEGSLNEMNNLLISMRELAIHAANEGFNDTAQLAADQAEIENAIKTIDRIAANTQFGTKNLLDGTKDNVATITTANSSKLSILQSGLTTGSHSITATKTADSAATLNTTSLGISLAATPNAYNLEEKIHNIDVLQASAGARKTSNSVQLTDAWNNGVTFAATAAAATIYGSVNTATALGATATHAGTYTVKLNYQENGEAVTGDQTLAVAIADGDSATDILGKWNDAIANSAQLQGKIEMVTLTTGGAAFRFQFQSVNTGGQYSLKLTSSAHDASTDRFNFQGTGARSNRGDSLNVLRWDALTNDYSAGAANVTIGAATYTSMTTLKDAIQTGITAAFGAATEIKTEVYDTDKLRFTTYDEGSSYTLQHLDAAAGTYERAQNVLGLTADSIARAGTDAWVSFDGYNNTVTAVKDGAYGTATLYNKADDGGANLGRGSVDIQIGYAANGINVGNLLLDVTAAKFNVRLDGGPATEVTAGKDTLLYDADRSNSLKLRYSLTSTGGSESINNTDQSLVFQIGANVGQTAKVALQNMAASALGKNLAGNMWIDLSKINVETVQGAQDAQAVIDAAINDVTNTRGNLGSFTKNTLESNLRNLRVAEQNLTASESGIRDTDMASVMSSFVKEQILLQAGTAMLAQANQLPQVVLSLFQ